MLLNEYKEIILKEFNQNEMKSIDLDYIFAEIYLYQFYKAWVIACDVTNKDDWNKKNSLNQLQISSNKQNQAMSKFHNLCKH